MRPLKLVRDKTARHEAIRRLIRSQRIATQEELVGLLAREGFELTQATLSRDLAQLGALRVSRPEGTVYELDAATLPAPARRLHELGELITGWADNETVVVLRTPPGDRFVAVAGVPRHARGGRHHLRRAGARRDDEAARTAVANTLWKGEHMSRQKIVLAYSGGLDTSVLVRILGDEYGYDVIACHADVGEAKDRERLAQKARQSGAVACEIVDAKDEFAREFCFPALQANALYEGVYPLSAALSRPLIAQHLVAAARKHGASAVAHGATGKGNDQVRFDLAVKGLAPDLKIIAPQRERNITRDAAIEYAQKHGIEVPASKKSPFSIDENLWGRSIEGGALEDPNTEPPEEAFAWTKSWKDAPEKPTYLKIGFEQGLPVSVDGKRLPPAELIVRVGQVAGENGVGRIDLMEDRVVGIKSRETYECPAAIALIAAHQDLERFTTLRQSLQVKQFLEQKFAELTYDGFWFSPLRHAIEAFNTEHAKTITGEVTIKLHKASLRVVGRTSPYGVYNHALSTYGVQDKFDHKAAEGFINLLGLSLHEFSRLHGGEQK